MRQIGAELVSDSKATTSEGLQAARRSAQTEREPVALLIVETGERRGSLGVGFENMMRSWVVE